MAVNPKLGSKRNGIRKGLRGFAQNSHVIFYRILKNRVRILRVLHTSRDLIVFFKA